MKYYFPDKSIEEYEEELQDLRKKQLERLEKDVDDVALSEWAGNITESVLISLIKLVENGGNSDFPVLCNLDGDPVQAKIINGQFGMCWALIDKNNHFTGKFLPYQPKRKSTLEKRGYKEVYKSLPACVVLRGGNNPYPVIVRDFRKEVKNELG